MNDGPIAFALIAIAIIGWALALTFAFQLKTAHDQIAKFDHDGDGKVGGSKAR